MSVTKISAVTFAVKDMKVSAAFYHQVGFQLLYGGPDEQFATFRSGDAYVNLVLNEDGQLEWCGRTIFQVDNVDAHYAFVRAAGFDPQPPREAPSGYRFFNLCDPDGHEIGFAEHASGMI